MLEDTTLFDENRIFPEVSRPQRLRKPLRRQRTAQTFFKSFVYDETGDGVETRLEFAADSFCEVPL